MISPVFLKLFGGKLKPIHRALLKICYASDFALSPDSFDLDRNIIYHLVSRSS
jgi:hypothetical protein